MHILCTICSDLVSPSDNIYVTKCGHLFHYQCLIQWIERSKTCPQCRQRVTNKCAFRLFPTVPEGSAEDADDAVTLRSRLDDASLQLRNQTATARETQKQLTELTEQLQRHEELQKTYEKKLVARESAVTALKEQLDYVKIQNKETQKLKEENVTLKKSIETLNGLQRVLSATSDEVERTLAAYSDLRTVATFTAALKRALCESEAKRRESREELVKMRGNLADMRAQILDLRTELNEERVTRAQTESKTKTEAKTESSPPTTSAPGSPHPHPPIDIKLSAPVRDIEKTESPYLRLKAGSLALSAARFPPAELASVRAMRRPDDSGCSIFSRKRAAPSGEEIGAAYDGLGGHARVSPSPSPAPKVFAVKTKGRHRLAKPRSQNIIAMLSSARD